MIIAALKDTDVDFEFFVKTMEKEGALKSKKVTKTKPKKKTTKVNKIPKIS